MYRYWVCDLELVEEYSSGGCQGDRSYTCLDTENILVNTGCEGKFRTKGVEFDCGSSLSPMTCEIPILSKDINMITKFWIMTSIANSDD